MAVADTACTPDVERLYAYMVYVQAGVLAGVDECRCNGSTWDQYMTVDFDRRYRQIDLLYCLLDSRKNCAMSDTSEKV